MGFYYSYGVEYCIHMNDEIIPIVSIKQADKRYLASNYYEKRKLDYVNGIYYPWCFRAPDCDVVLTSEEQARLDEALLDFGKSVRYHGWYDVCRCMTTL